MQDDRSQEREAGGGGDDQVYTQGSSGGPEDLTRRPGQPAPVAASPAFHLLTFSNFSSPPAPTSIFAPSRPLIHSRQHEPPTAASSLRTFRRADVGSRLRFSNSEAPPMTSRGGVSSRGINWPNNPCSGSEACFLASRHRRLTAADPPGTPQPRNPTGPRNPTKP